MRGDKAGGRDAKPKPVKRVWRSQPKCVQLGGVVNGHDTPILLDSGAAISVVPESLVEPSQMAEHKVLATTLLSVHNLLNTHFAGTLQLKEFNFSYLFLRQ